MSTKFKNKKTARPYILDGAIGSLIQQKEYHSNSALWSSMANIDRPEIVQKIHEEYMLSGADIITTNTFRTNPIAVEKANLKIGIDELVRRSVNLIKSSSILTDKIIIAGSNAPAEDCYQKERTFSKSSLEYNHKKHIEILWENNCDIILNETQSHLDEIEIICDFCSVNKIDYIISLYFDKNLRILSGESLSSVIKDIQQYLPSSIAFNCIDSELFQSAVDEINLTDKWGVYLNCGSGNVTDKEISCGISPTNYLDIIKQVQKYKPYFVGACCGSSPDHIKTIKEYFDEFY